MLLVVVVLLLFLDGSDGIQSTRECAATTTTSTEEEVDGVNDTCLSSFGESRLGGARAKPDQGQTSFAKARPSIVSKTRTNDIVDLNLSK